MSLTAQKQDFSDPAVIATFAAKVRTERRLAALYLLTVADIRGTSPRGVERVEGQAARGPVSRSASASDRQRPDPHAGRQPGGAPRRGGAPAAPLRHSRRRRAGAVATARQRLLPAPQRRRDRLACASAVFSRRRPGAGGQGAPVARRRRAAGDDLPARPEGALRAHLRLLRQGAAVDPRREDSYHPPRLRARYLPRARPAQRRTPRTAPSPATSSSN